jgi:arylsulfatase A-like enzyme
VAEAEAPNVLLIILDTVRAASLSLYGGRAATPTLDSLAASGVAFDRAVSPAPWTLPSHASVFTGLWPHEHGADWRAPLDKRAPTLAEVLARRGYRTGGFVANLVFTSREHGLHRGFQVYRDYRRSPGALLRSASLVQTIVTSKQLRRLTSAREVTGRKQAHHVNDEFLAWEGDADDGPWFAFLNYYDAHEPYLPRAPYAGRYSAGLPPRRFDRQVFWHVEGLMGSWEGLRPDEVEAERAAYEEAITGLDAAIGEMLSELRRRGSLERTIVVLTSDHGELFGEHDTFVHGNSVFWRTIHVPLLISWPGRVPAGVRVADPVTLRDVPSTILSLAMPESRASLPGAPLPFSPDASRAGTHVLSELSTEEFTADDPPMRNGALQALVGPTWQYTRAANGHVDVFWTGLGVRSVDTLLPDAPARAAIVDTARAALSVARIPAPRDTTR